MTHTHRDTTFKISEIIFNMRIFTMSLELLKLSNFLRRPVAYIIEKQARNAEVSRQRPN